jgi:hypothetical protein
MRVKEYHNLIIRKYPYAESLNKRLLKDAESLLESHPSSGFTNVHGKRTSQIYEHSTNVQKLVGWILNEYRYDKSIQGWSPDDKYIKRRVGVWLARYNKGDYTQKHHHRPHTWGFAYFVNCPKGASPLVFPTSGKRIKAEEGKVVIFDAQVLHEVPKNKCDNRIVCAGNVTSWTEGFASPYDSAPINI